MTLTFSDTFDANATDVTVLSPEAPTPESDFAEPSSIVPTPSTSRTPIPEASKKRKREQRETEEQILQMIKDKMKGEQESALAVFGKNIALSLSTVDKRQCTIAKKLISDIVFYAEMGCLQPNVCLQNLEL